MKYKGIIGTKQALQHLLDVYPEFSTMTIKEFCEKFEKFEGLINSVADRQRFSLPEGGQVVAQSSKQSLEQAEKGRHLFSSAQRLLDELDEATPPSH